MSLNGMAESRRLWCYRRVWLKCSKTVARQSQVLPVRACPRLQQGSQDNPASPSAIARILYRGPGKARLLCSFALAPNRGRAGRQGSKGTRGASTPRDIEACRSPVCLTFRSGSSDRQSVPQVRQTQGVPRAVFNRLAPHRPRWSHFSRVMPVGAAPRLPTDEAMALGRRPLTGRPGLPAVRDLGAQTRRAGLDAAWTAGPPIASPMQGHVPATAPHPASGDADQTPLGNEAG